MSWNMDMDVLLDIMTRWKLEHARVTVRELRETGVACEMLAILRFV